MADMQNGIVSAIAAVSPRRQETLCGAGRLRPAMGQRMLPMTSLGGVSVGLLQQSETLPKAERMCGIFAPAIVEALYLLDTGRSSMAILSLAAAFAPSALQQLNTALKHGALIRPTAT